MATPSRFREPLPLLGPSIETAYRAKCSPARIRSEFTDLSPWRNGRSSFTRFVPLENPKGVGYLNGAARHPCTLGGRSAEATEIMPANRVRSRGEDGATPDYKAHCRVVVDAKRGRTSGVRFG